MLLILFACFAPKPLSDDEEILVDEGGIVDTADTGVATGFDSGAEDVTDTSGASTPRDHSRVRLEGWLTSGAEVAATEVVGGDLQLRRTTSGMSCLHTGLVLPCGEASAAALIVDGDVITVPYAIDHGLDSGEGSRMCAWTMSYSLVGLAAGGGVVQVTYATTGQELVSIPFGPASAEGSP